MAIEITYQMMFNIISYSMSLVFLIFGIIIWKHDYFKEGIIVSFLLSIAFFLVGLNSHLELIILV